MIDKFFLKFTLFAYLMINVLLSQSDSFELNSFFVQRINSEHDRVNSQEIRDKNHFLKLSYYNFIYLNSNLPNLEKCLSRECLILAWKMFDFSYYNCLILLLIFK